jgi:hypothetical protein
VKLVPFPMVLEIEFFSSLLELKAQVILNRLRGAEARSFTPAHCIGFLQPARFSAAQ